MRELPVECVHQALPRTMFDDPTVLYAVGMVVIRGNKVVLGHPKRAPEGWYVMPQECIEPSDGNLNLAFMRGVREEVGMAGQLRPVILGGFVNRMPVDEARKRLGVTEKRIICVASRAPNLQLVENEEIDHFYEAASWEELDAAMTRVAEERGTKYIATCIAIRRAIRRGLLNWPPH